MYLKKANFIFLFILVCSLNVFGQLNSQNQQPPSITIAGISVVGNEFADVETIITLSGLKVGDNLVLPFDRKLQSAIKNLWLRKQFSDVNIVVDRVSPIGLFLEIQVKEFPRLSYIDVLNNKDVDRFEIVKAISKIRGDIISNYDLKIIEKDVKNLYLKEGYGFAKISAHLEKTDTASYSKLIVDINEGADFKVGSITFNGNKAFENSDLAGSFDDTKTKVWWQFWKTNRFEKDKYIKDKELLVKFYQKNGFTDARIIKDSIIYDESKSLVYISLDIDEGVKKFVRNINFTGNTVYPEYSLLNRLEFSKGDAYNIEKFQKNLLGNENQTDCFALYMDNGYLQARLMPELSIVSSDTVDITIKVIEGERYRLGRVEIVGNDKTKDKVIRRELFTRPGDYFDRSAIIRSLRALQAMQYFNPESIKPEPKPSATDNNTVDLVYTVEERSTDTFNASIGFAGSFGLTGAIGFTFNNFSLSEPLKGGAGQIFNFNWEFGQANRYQTFTIGLTEPWLFDSPTTVGFNLFDTYYNYLSLDQRRTGASINLGRRFRWPDDYWRADWSIRAQINDNATASYYYRAGKYSEITFSQKISRTSINNMFFPSSGSRFSFATNFAMSAIGLGQTDYFKNELSYETFTPVLQVKGMDRVVFALSAKLGYISGFNSDTTISALELYRMGGNGLSGFGVTPLRGYQDDQIGSSTGSKALAKYSAELRFALALDPMPIYFYLFADAGNVWNDLKNTEPFNLKRSAGFGLQLLVNPIGIIGFSYGYGFDDTREDPNVPSGWRFLFHLGQ